MQLTQLTRGQTGGYIDKSIIIQNQSIFDPLQLCSEMSPGSYEAEVMQTKSKTTERNECSESNAAETKPNQDQSKVRLQC